jgi:hypothetical protein
MFDSKQLENDRIMYAYSITREDRLRLVLRLHGEDFALLTGMDSKVISITLVLPDGDETRSASARGCKPECCLITLYST